MWSLYKKKVCQSIDKEEKVDENEVKVPSFEDDGDELKPLMFSNGKNQADIVKEIVDEIGKGTKIIFIKGVCGSGKSALALNLARHFKKTSIVVPIKSLQEQYEYDYTHHKFILKKDKSKLKISVVKGRNNFECPYLGGNADAEDLPCKIELREKNFDKLMKYIEQNKEVSKFDFSSLQDIKRISIAPACPYWSPLMPAESKAKSLEKAKKFRYKAISDKEYCFYQREKGCGYYDQYEAYINSDVLIFNSQKYLLEGILKRKPKTDLDIIDECDEFLDSFANEKSISLSRLASALSSIVPDNPESKLAIKEIIYLVNDFLYNEQETDIEKIEKTPYIKLIQKIIDNPYLAEDEEDNYYNKVFEIAKEFEPFFEETYASFSKTAKFFGESNKRQTSLFNNNTNLNQNSDGFLNNLFGKKQQTENVYLTLVTINLAKRFQELLDNTQSLVLMSGTLHTERVLKDIFGLDKFKVIEAETQNPGTIVKYRTGLEKNCKYENIKSGLVSRKDYLKALSLCVESAKKPLVVHVNSFEDMPTELERDEFALHNLISREKLRELQEKSNEQVDNFKNGKTDILFTTKCSRGVDFPGEKCNSIIITKFPYPNIQNLFWKILRREKPEKFTEFYMDKARRDLFQKIARAVRFKGDHVILLSPDSRVLDAYLG